MSGIIGSQNRFGRDFNNPDAAMHLSRRQRHPRPPDGPLRPPHPADGLLGGPVSVFRDGFDPPLAGAEHRVETFIIFAVLNAAFIPMVYCFYPETKGLELEDIPLLFAKGGVTGGVLSSKGGGTVTPGQHARDVEVERKVEVQEVEEAASIDIDNHRQVTFSSASQTT
ncbi:uncharacterized protein NFIA_058170 [Aspergillus fischeri NRRL 181]|uniref:Uncharacterized protein n=1 Tax=Neosartorya fischeri (strain ATCC 1020 / DSM 3700 / CBS 544.65 / FGSC A1164 / JCM 1740 / NRRL 181 / WB 181) TaxID=331117 RepID=A1DNU6_NEOFI|nr:uncharacterized protein NFIA_058170 [Aspergillus fischeri NRRL 181]EAW16467.1 hypothetical protein NFIA_058170 [Aspergillus fischeri NRRL 181]